MTDYNFATLVESWANKKLKVHKSQDNKTFNTT